MLAQKPLPNTITFSDTEGDMTRLQAQLLAGGFQNVKIVSDSNGHQSIDAAFFQNAHNKTLLGTTTINFAGDVIKDASGTDGAYQFIQQLRQNGATVNCIVGNRDSNVLMPMLHLRRLSELAQHEYDYWCTGQPDQKPTTTEITQLNTSFKLLQTLATVPQSNIQPLLALPSLNVTTVNTFYQTLIKAVKNDDKKQAAVAALKKEQALIIQHLAQINANKETLKRILSHSKDGARGKAEYSVKDAHLQAHLMHVDPGQVSFLTFLMTQSDPNTVDGLLCTQILQAMKIDSSKSCSEQSQQIITALNTPEWTVPVDGAPLSDPQKQLNGAYLSWLTKSSIGEGDHFQNEKKIKPVENGVTALIKSAEHRLTASLPGGAYFDYLIHAVGAIQHQANMTITHSIPSDPKAVAHAQKMQKNCHYLLAQLRDARKTGNTQKINQLLQDPQNQEILNALTVMGLPDSVRTNLPEPYKFTANCIDARGSNSIPKTPSNPPPVSTNGHATHAPGTDNGPLVMTLYPNGSALFSIDPTYSPPNVMTMRTHTWSNGDTLYMAVIYNTDSKKLTCTQAIIVNKTGELSIVNDPKKLLAIDGSTKTDKIQSKPYDLYDPEHMQGMTLTHVPKELLTTAFWGTTIPKLDSGAHIYKDLKGEYRLTTYAGFASVQSNPIPVEFLQLLVLQQHLQSSNPSISTDEKVKMASQANSLLDKLKQNSSTSPLISSAAETILATFQKSMSDNIKRQTEPQRGPHVLFITPPPPQQGPKQVSQSVSQSEPIKSPKKSS